MKKKNAGKDDPSAGMGKILSGLPIGSIFSKEELAEIERRGEIRVYRKGSSVYESDVDSQSRLFIVVEGHFSIISRRTGKEIFISVLGDGEFLGSSVLEEERVDNNFFYRALDSCKVLVIPTDFNCLSENPDFLTWMIRMTQWRLDNSQFFLELRELPVKERIDRCLEFHPWLKEASVTIIAEICSTTRPTASKIINNMRSKTSAGKKKQRRF